MSSADGARVERCDHPEDLLESHLLRHSTRSQAIYLAVVGLVTLGLALLPLVRVGISVRGAGIVRPALEKQEVRTIGAGYVERTTLRNGLQVEAGDELLRLRSDGVAGAERVATERVREAEAEVRALELLASGRSVEAAAHGARWGGEYRRYLGERRERSEELAQLEREVARSRDLAARQLLAPASLEAAEMRLARAGSELRDVDESYASVWREALANARMRLLGFREELARARDAADRLVLRAPAAGVVEEVAVPPPGAFLPAGEVVASLSPGAELLAEVLVAPRDVALLAKSDAARLLIDAFDHRDWGPLTGRVARIPEDFVLIEGRPAFRIQVVLDSTHLLLPNGVRGELRKGMTLQARFLVAERPLWQLLRDDLSDWLDPVRHPPTPS